MYRWTSHTGEEQLQIEAESPSTVLAEAVDALGRAVELNRRGDPASHELALEADDLAGLLVSLLDELVLLADTEGFVPDRSNLRLRGTHLEGTVAGRRTTVRPLVKAATYSGLRFEEIDGAWYATVVLDV